MTKAPTFLEKELSTTAATMPCDISHMLAFSEVVSSHRSASRLWTGQGYMLDPVAAASYCAGYDFRVPTGFGVLTTPRRHPADAALAAHTVAAFSEEQVIYGVGPASRPQQRALLGRELESPLAHTEAYISRFREAASEIEKSSPLPERIRPRLGVGVLGPKMAELCGRSADAAITWLCPPEYLRSQLIPALDAGADAAGRPRPKVVAYVPVVVGAEHRDIIEYCANAIGGHLELGHYQAALRRAGIEVSGPVRERAAAFLDAEGMLAGTPEEIIAGLDAYYGAGVDEVVLHQPASAVIDGIAAALADTVALFDSADTKATVSAG